MFLDYLRAAAAWLVVWDHLANVMPGWANLTFAPAHWVGKYVTTPLGIINNFGWFGVAVFFLISGFIITDRARVETTAEFSVKRVLRIYPMLAVAVGLSAAFVATRDQVTVRNVLLNMTLANYLTLPQVALVGAAWTLAIEVVFYALTAATQVLRNSPHRMAVNLAFVLVVVRARGALGPEFNLLAISVAYLPILVMGQAIYWWLAQRRLSAGWGLAYLIAAYAVFLWAMKLTQPAFLTPANSYPISVIYAVALFVCLRSIPLKARRSLRFLADTSYSLYLLHGIVGYLVLAALLHRTSLGVAIAAAAAASLASAAIAYRLIERPVQKLARRITWRRASALTASR